MEYCVWRLETRRVRHPQAPARAQSPTRNTRIKRRKFRLTFWVILAFQDQGFLSQNFWNELKREKEKEGGASCVTSWMLPGTLGCGTHTPAVSAGKTRPAVAPPPHPRTRFSTPPKHTAYLRCPPLARTITCTTCAVVTPTQLNVSVSLISLPCANSRILSGSTGKSSCPAL
jgi:hypothetical protein